MVTFRSRSRRNGRDESRGVNDRPRILHEVGAAGVVAKRSRAELSSRASKGFEI